MTDINKLKEIFRNQDLLDQALTHKSWVNEHPEKRGSNERLEFLGDAVLEFLVSKELFNRFPEEEEGYLTALRANLVNTQNLANLSRKLGVGEAIYLSKGEEDGGGRENESLLADTMEAIIGALFMDSGIEAAWQFVKTNVLSEIAEKVKEPLKDPKSRLQESAQSKNLPAPKYQVIQEFGPDHAKNFVVEVSVDNKVLGRGEGKSKAIAEQEAAQKALESHYL